MKQSLEVSHISLSLLSQDQNPLFSWMMYLFSWKHVSIFIRIILLPEDTWRWRAMLRTGNAKWRVSVATWNYRNSNSTDNHRNLMEIVYQLNLNGQQTEAKGDEKSVNEACVEWPWCFADITLEKVKSNITKMSQRISQMPYKCLLMALNEEIGWKCLQSHYDFIFLHMVIFFLFKEFPNKNS